MRFPQIPPDMAKVLADWTKEDADSAWELIFKAQKVGVSDPYLHWEEFRRRPATEGRSPERSWALIRMARQTAARKTPFADTSETVFSYVETPQIRRRLHEIDSEARGSLGAAAPLPGAAAPIRYLVKSLIEEPFSSSALEGAATTRADAKKMIETNARPRTRDDQMILNNYQAMRFVKQHADEPLSPRLIHEIHEIIVEKAIDLPEKAGVFRTAADSINVVDERDDEILHTPPEAAQLSKRMDLLCAFANGDGDAGEFTHPVIRAIVLHFMLAYDHPYYDGNGRTARALFYWSILRSGYWLLEYVSISRIFNRAPTRYYRSFLHVETDGADLTYFIIDQLETIATALKELKSYLQAKSREIADVELAIEASALHKRLNHRQLQLINDMARNPELRFTITAHEKEARVSRLTARKDLEGLVELGLASKRRAGRHAEYRAAPALPSRIAATRPRP